MVRFGVSAFVMTLVAPAFAQYAPPKQMTLTSTGVNLGDGRFVHTVTDLSVGPFTLERSHHGGQQKYPSKMFGLSWTHNYDIYVMEGDGLHQGDTPIIMGRTSATFSRGSSFLPFSPEDIGSTLTVVGGNFVYTTKQGDIYTFNQYVQATTPIGALRNQRIDNIVYADGRRLDFVYSSMKLVRVTSNLGYALVFDYNAAGNVSAACGFNTAQTYVPSGTTCAGAQLKTSYTYDGSSMLSSVTDVMGQSWGYSYTGGGINSVGCVMQVNSTSCLISNTFGATGKPSQVDHQTTPDGLSRVYYWDGADPDNPRKPWEPPTSTSGSLYGPESQEIVAVFGGGLLTEYNENGRASQFQWNGLLLTKLFYREANYVSKAFDLNNNDAGDTWTGKPGSGLTVSRSTTYPAKTSTGLVAVCDTAGPKTCNKPLTVSDYMGNQTVYTYSESHGGVLTETGPAVDGITPQTRYTYTSTPRYAWIKTSSGGYTQAAAPIYLLTQKSTCLKGAPASGGTGCALAGDEVKVSYDYGPDSGPNNLLVRGETVESGGVVHRSCYGYDWQGNKVSTTLPRAGLATCP